jgi:hypothetical protein
MSQAPARSVRAHASIAGAVALCLVLAGCRGAQLERDVYQRELRLQEDEIYKLEDYLGEYQQMVRQIRCENAELKKRLDELETASLSTPSAARDEDPEESLLDRRRRRRTNGASKYDPKPAPEPEEESPAIPDIEFGAPSQTLTPETDPTAVDAPDAADIPLPEAAEEPPPFKPTDVPSTSGQPEAEAPPFQPEKSQSQTGPRLLRLSQAPAAQPITLATTIEPAPLPLTSATPITPPPIVPTLDRVTFTFEPAGIDATGVSTLKLRVQPRDAQGKLLSLSGTAAVLVVDPNAPPESEKLARWDFAQHELAAAWQASGDERHLELWVGLPADLPRDRPLELWIRIVDGAGRRAIDHQPLEPRESELEVAAPIAESESAGWRASGPQAEGDSEIRLVTHEEAVK